MAAGVSHLNSEDKLKREIRKRTPDETLGREMQKANWEDKFVMGALRGTGAPCGTGAPTRTRLLAPARSAAAFATARHSAAARCGGPRLLHRTQRISCAVLLCAVTRPWPRRLDGRTPSSRCCSPLVAAAIARAARARSVGRRIRNGSTLGRRSMRRPSPPALNAARVFAPCFSAQSHVVAAADRRPPAVESLLRAARRGDAHARCSRPLGRPPLLRWLNTWPPLDAAALQR